VYPLCRPSTARGFTLVELLMAMAILGIVLLVSFPSLDRATERYRLRLAAGEGRRILLLARCYAIRHSAHVGVKLYPGDGDKPTTWSLHVDGDGDGVRSRDVEAGVDPPVPSALGLLHRTARFAGRVVPGFPPGPLPRDPSGRRLTRRDDPIRFNRSDLAVFSPIGTATPGTLYLTDGRGLAAVRVAGRTGRIRALVYDADAGSWR
jgi:prepilin-type N-terminal cleavage/methylation domain-containing protein